MPGYARGWGCVSTFLQATNSISVSPTGAGTPSNDAKDALPYYQANVGLPLETFQALLADKLPRLRFSILVKYGLDIMNQTHGFLDGVTEI